MEGRVTSITAQERVQSGQGTQHLGPDSGSASGRTAVTKADEGVAPGSRGTMQLGTSTSTTASVGVAELTHADVRAQLSDYLDDALGEAARHRIDKHLAACSPCRAFLESLRLTVKASASLPPAKAPERVRASILDLARREHDASPVDA
jgi:putative zinc finger protein